MKITVMMIVDITISTAMIPKLNRFVNELFAITNEVFSYFFCKDSSFI